MFVECQPRPRTKVAEPYAALPTLSDSPLSMATPFNAERPRSATHVGSRRGALEVSHALLSQESGIPALPIFEVLLYVCLPHLTQNYQFRRGNIYGYLGAFLG